jgi:hypothetical protein
MGSVDDGEDGGKDEDSDSDEGAGAGAGKGGGDFAAAPGGDSGLITLLIIERKWGKCTISPLNTISSTGTPARLIASLHAAMTRCRKRAEA